MSVFYSQVSRGAQEIFNLLPHEWVSPRDLKHLTSGHNADLHKCYAVLAEPEQYVTPRDGTSNSGRSTVDRRHYYANPHEYKSISTRFFSPTPPC